MIRAYFRPADPDVDRTIGFENAMEPMDNPYLPFPPIAPLSVGTLGPVRRAQRMNELAVRDFLDRRARLRRLTPPQCATVLVAAKSKRHGISVNPIGQRHASRSGWHRRMSARSGTVLTGSLRELRKEHQEFTRIAMDSTTPRTRPRLKFTLENLFSTEQKGVLAIGPHRHGLMEYCRLVRNRLAHPRSTSDKAVADAYDRVAHH